MQKLNQRLLLGTLLFAVALFAAPAVAQTGASAQEKPAPTQETTQQKTEASAHQKSVMQQKALAQKQELAQAKAAAQERVAEHREAAKAKLTEAKLKACQHREKNISNIMARQADRGTKQLAVFTKISERTQKFYVEKGRILSTYDALVADVNVKKAAAEAALSTTNGLTTTFKCDGTDPKGAALHFKDNMKTQNEALKAYKTSVKNLIVGVKSVNGKTSSTEAKTSQGDQE